MYSGLIAFEKKTFVPALVGAGLSLFFLKSGFLSFFFLVPLGFVCYKYHYKIAWLAFFLASLGNIIIAVGNSAGFAAGITGGNSGGPGIPFAIISLDILYFAVMTFIFTWIISPPPALSVNMSGFVRLMTGSCLGAMALTFLLFKTMASQGFLEYLNLMMKSLLSASSGANVVQSALLDIWTAESAIETIKAIMLRGGSLLTCVMLFFLCSQMSLFLVRMSLRGRRVNAPEEYPSKMASVGINSGGINSVGTNSTEIISFSVFHVAPAAIWVFSSSLLLVVFTRVTKLEIPEIILWNILIVCAILYFAQGLGILQSFFQRSSFTPFVRLLFGVLIVVMLLSPFLNVFFLGGLVLLGIAENWVPFRAPKQNGPPSTPEAGGEL